MYLGCDDVRLEVVSSHIYLYYTQTLRVPRQDSRDKILLAQYLHSAVCSSSNSD